MCFDFKVFLWVVGLFLPSVAVGLWVSATLINAPPISLTRTVITTLIFAGFPTWVSWSLGMRNFGTRWGRTGRDSFQHLAATSFVIGLGAVILASIATRVTPERSWSWLGLIVVGGAVSLPTTFLLRRALQATK